MVQLDLNLKEIIGLAETGSINNDKLKTYLAKYSKEEFIEFILQDFVDAETKEEEDIPL